MPSGKISDLPRSTRRYTFALTPLADAMFQLLIFFMLTSSLTPYSLLTLRSGSNANSNVPAAAAEQNQPQQQPSKTATWLIENGQIIASGQAFNFDLLPQMADALIAAKTPQVLLITKPSAQVQDLVFVLERLSAAGIEAVQIAGSVRE